MRPATKARYERIVTLRRAGHSLRRVARAFGVSQETVRNAQRALGIRREKLPSPPAVPSKTARNAEIVTLLEGGTYTLEEVAAVYGITRERVRQLRNRAGVAPRQAVALDNPTAVLGAARAPGVTTAEEVIRRVGTGGDIWKVLNAIGASAAVRRLWRIRRGRPLRERRRVMLTQIRAEAERLGRIPTLREMGVVVTGKDYGAQAGPAIAGLWSGSPARAGALSDLRRAAGFPTHSYQRTVKRGALKRAILRLAARAEGATILDIVRETGTAYETAMVTADHWVRDGRLAKTRYLHRSRWRPRYFLKQ